MGKMLRGLDTIKQIAAANIFNKNYPLSVTYLVTYSCNFRCKYCGIWKYPRAKELTTKQALSMIDQFTDMGTKRFSFNGGEPLLRNDLKTLIRRTKDNGMISTVFTNGSLVKKRINDIKSIDLLLISLDGPKEVHDKQRFNGAYDKVIEAIKIAKKHNIEVWTNTVLTKNNLDYIDFILDKAKELGSKMIFQPALRYSHSARQQDMIRIAPLIEKYKGTIEKLKKEKKKRNTPIIHSIQYLDHVSKPIWGVNKRKCWAGRLYCTVKPDGTVAPCYPIFNSREWPSGLELGFKKAFDRMPKFTCDGCYCSTIESDFFYSLHPGVIYNALKHMVSAA